VELGVWDVPEPDEPHPAIKTAATANTAMAALRKAHRLRLLAMHGHRIENLTCH